MGNLATNIGYASGRHQKPNDFWDFLVYHMNEYDTDDKITRIAEIEKELTEREATMPEQEHEELRQEYRNLLVKCFDEAICNKIDRDFPGGLAMEAYELQL